MKTAFAKMSSFFALTLLFLSSCSDPSMPADDTSLKLPSKDEVAQYLINGSGTTISRENVYGHLMLSSIKSSGIEFPHSLRIFENTHADFRDLPDTTSKSVDVGTVTLNGTTIPISTSDGASTYGVINYPVTSGQTYTWSIGGGNGYPPIKLSCPAPSKVNVTFPVENDSIDRNSELTVRWEGDDDKNNIVFVSIGGPDYGVGYYTDDDGSYTFSASTVAALGKGIGRVRVSRNRYNIATITENKYVFARIHSDHSLEFIFKD